MAENNTSERSFICKTCGEDKPRGAYRFAVSKGYAYRNHACRNCQRLAGIRGGVVRICEVCAKPFKARKDRGAKYCSLRCFGDANTTRVEIVCAGCRVPFTIPRGMVGRIFKCKAGCSGGKIEKKCVWCKESFWVYPYRQSSARYCSLACPYRPHKKARHWSDHIRDKMQPSRMMQMSSPTARFVEMAGSLGYFTKQEWDALVTKCGHRCVACGQKRKLTGDHIVPITRGGTNHIWNIQPLCRQCNSRKNNKTINYLPTHLQTQPPLLEVAV